MILFALALSPGLALADKVDALLKAEMDKHQIAGLSIMVVRNGRQVKSKGYGVANLEWNAPVTPETVFEIGSITKQFTAACILLLVEAPDAGAVHRKNRRAAVELPAGRFVVLLQHRLQFARLYHRKRQREELLGFFARADFAAAGHEGNRRPQAGKHCAKTRRRL